MADITQITYNDSYFFKKKQVFLQDFIRILQKYLLLLKKWDELWSAEISPLTGFESSIQSETPLPYAF